MPPIEPHEEREYREPRREEGYRRGPQTNQRGTKALGSRGGLVSLLGAGAVVLAILALVGLAPRGLTALACIAVGAGFLMAGGAIAAAYRHVSTRFDETGRKTTTAIGGASSAQLVGGAAGIALGILALFGVAPMTLLPITAIVLGGTAALGAGAQNRAQLFLARPHLDDSGAHAGEQAVKAASGAQVLVGLGAVALGILVLADVGSPILLTLVAFLALGVALVLSGGAIGTRTGTSIHH